MEPPSHVSGEAPTLTYSTVTSDAVLDSRPTGAGGGAAGAGGDALLPPSDVDASDSAALHSSLAPPEEEPSNIKDVSNRSMDPISVIRVHDVILTVLSFLDADELHAVGCTSKAWRDAAREESLWSAACARDWDVRARAAEGGSGGGSAASSSSGGAGAHSGRSDALSPGMRELDKRGTPWIPAESWRAAWLMHEAAYGRYRRDRVFSRVSAVWRRIEDVLQTHTPLHYAALAPGASEAELDELEFEADLAMPPAVTCMWRFHNGTTRASADSGGVPPALFGGALSYGVYYHRLFYSTAQARMLAVTLSRAAERGVLQADDLLPIAGGGPRSLRTSLCVRCSTGELVVDPVRALPAEPSASACAKARAAGRAPIDGRLAAPDSLIRWMEEWARRVETGVYRTAVLPGIEPPMPYISLFSNDPAVQRTAITRGVVVQTSPLYVHGAPNLADAHVWTYRIRMWLEAEAPFESVQLTSRHWDICMEDEVPQSVTGDGVIGEYPLLRSSEGDDGLFEYCSLTYSASSPRGTMGGYFVMVPGRIAAPTGEPFQVEVPTFDLQVPDYIFG